MPIMRMDRPRTLKETIDDLIADMQGTKPDTKEYANMADQLVKLHTMKMNEKSNRLSRDTMATIFANLVGIVIIVAFERTNVMTSKALGLVQKLR